MKSVSALAALCVTDGLLDERSYLLHNPETHLFDEFAILTLVAADRKGLQEWRRNWPIQPGMAIEVLRLANSAEVGPPTAAGEPHAWAWYCHHIFGLPVHNVLAERQFNLANIYLSANESEISRQATQLFAQNILHGGQSVARTTNETIRTVISSMKNYSSSVTDEQVAEARSGLKISENRIRHENPDGCRGLQRRVVSPSVSRGVRQ
eukprot:scpid18065/ scgid31604/ 